MSRRRSEAESLKLAARGVAYEHISWARANDMSPGEVMRSIGGHAPACGSWFKVENILAQRWIQMGCGAAT